MEGLLNMQWKRKLGFGLALVLGGPAVASAQLQSVNTGTSTVPVVVAPAAKDVVVMPTMAAPTTSVAQAPAGETPPVAGTTPETRGAQIATEEGRAQPGE